MIVPTRAVESEVRSEPMRSCRRRSSSKAPVEALVLNKDETALETTTQTERLFLEDMNVGDRWESGWREITADDVAEFAVLTGDHDPLHGEDGANSPFGEPVAHGLLGLSVLAGLSTEHPRVSTLALVSLTDWEFEAPIFFGDSVQVVTEIEEIRQHGRRAGRVTWHRQLLNQDGRVVQQGRFVSLVARRTRAPRIAETSETSQRGSLPAR